MGKLIRLEIQGEFNLGFSINAKIEEDSPLLSPSDNRLIAGITGKLADNLQLLEKYRDWQAIYRNVTASFPTFPLQRRPSLTNVSANILENDFEPFKKQTNDLINSFNAWLKDKAFLPIESLLRNHLNPNEENRILLLTDNPWLRKLPWQEWDLLREFPKTEIGFASPNFKQVRQLAPTSKDGVKILGIFGYQADVESQGQAIQNLEKNVNCPPNPPNMGGAGFNVNRPPNPPNMGGAGFFAPQVWGVGGHYNFSVTPVEVTWLKQPKREELDEPLWKQRWDIIFFVGHGESQDEWKTGTIWINETDKITISELRNHLKKAIENGLKLAILNCCDGLGLAHSLAEGEDLYLPQMIVMREELPVAVAPRFLQYFLEEFTQYNSLYASVREARRRLQILEKEFPCASNLPVICQNPAVKPLRWNDLVIPACPYRGLSAFQEEDAELFFGRESFTNHLVKVVEDKKLVAVIGASGSGKSSVVLAGLIPRLRQKENWLIASLRPGATPFENLAKALLLPEQLATELQEGIRSFSDVVKSIGESRTMLLVVDQFEEIYSYPNQKFLDCLLDAVRDVSAFRLVITLRADFLGQAIEYNPLREQLQRWKSEFIGAMERQQLQAVIEAPAKKRGVYLEAGLTEHILNDVGNEPGYLPLLEFALTEMWNKQENGWLTRQVYDDIGGVENALRRHAERVYDELEKSDRERVKRIFLQLVSPGEGTEYIRRLATRAEVGEANWDLVIRLATARLVVSSRNETTEIETVEIVHEALIKAWPDLQKWIEEDDVFLRWKKRLQAALKEWERNDNKEGYLLQGAPLGEAEGYLQQRLGDISPAERVFIQLGLGLRDRQRRRTILSLTSGLVAISIFATGAVWQWQRAERQRLISESDSLGNLALNQFQSGEGGINSLMIAMEAGQKLKQLVKDGEPLANYPTTSALFALHTITGNIREKNEIKSDTDAINKAIFTPDGKQIVSFSRIDGKVIIWNFSGQRVAEWDDPDEKQIVDLAISPNGKFIATINEQGRLYVWDLAGKKIAETAPIGIGHKIVKFSPDSKYIAVTTTYSVNVSFFDLSCKKVNELVTNGGGTIHSLEFTANGEELVTGNAVGLVQFWNLKTQQKVREFKANTYQVVKIAISPNGKQLLTLGVDITSSKTISITHRLWDLSGKKIADFGFSQLMAGTDVTGDASFSPNGQQIATIMPGEGIAKLYDSKSGQLTDQVTVSSLFGFSLSYSPDGQIIAISGVNGIKLLSQTKSNVTELPVNYEIVRNPNKVKERTLINLRYSADGKKILVTYILWNINSGNLDVWDWRSKKLIKRFDFKKNIVNITPDGKYIIITTKEGVQKIDLEGQLISEVKTKVTENEKVLDAFNNFSSDPYIVDRNYSSSFDGSKIVTQGYNLDKVENLHPLRFWDLSTKQVKELKNDYIPEILRRVVVSPNGKYILTIASARGKLWDNSGNLIAGLGDVKAKPSGKGIEVSMIGILLDTSKTDSTFFDKNQKIFYSSGIKITEVLQNSTAMKAGLKSGDIILEIDGHKVSDMKNEYKFLNGEPGTNVKIKVKTNREYINDKIEEKIIIREKFVYDKNQFIWGNTGKISPDSKYLASFDEPGSKEISLRNISNNKVIKINNEAASMGVYFSPDSKLIATSGTDNYIKIWDISGKIINKIKLEQSLGGLTFSPDSQQIGFLGHRNELSIWNIAGKQIAKYTISEQGQGQIQFSPDGKYIATGGRKVLIWRNQNLNELLATGCDWLKEYLATRPEEKQKLKVCQANPNSK